MHSLEVSTDELMAPQDILTCQTFTEQHCGPHIKLCQQPLSTLEPMPVQNKLTYLQTYHCWCQDVGLMLQDCARAYAVTHGSAGQQRTLLARCAAMSSIIETASY